MRQTKKISVSNIKLLKKQLLTWSQYSNSVIWLDSSECKHKYSNFDAILAVDANTSLTTSFHSAFEKLNNFKARVSDWIFGYLNYDLKNDLEDLKSDNIDNLDFPDLFFFQPKKIFFLKDNTLTISYLKEFSNLIDEDLLKIQTKTRSWGFQYFKAIKEGFIIDVLDNYMSFKRYYKLIPLVY